MNTVTKLRELALPQLTEAEQDKQIVSTWPVGLFRVFVLASQNAGLTNNASLARSYRKQLFLRFQRTTIIKVEKVLRTLRPRLSVLVSAAAEGWTSYGRQLDKLPEVDPITVALIYELCWLVATEIEDYQNSPEAQGGRPADWTEDDTPR